MIFTTIGNFYSGDFFYTKIHFSVINIILSFTNAIHITKSTENNICCFEQKYLILLAKMHDLFP